MVDLVCGPEYSLALVQGGHAYTWGCGAEGKLGHQDHNNKKIPTKETNAACCMLPSLDLL